MVLYALECFFFSLSVSRVLGLLANRVEACSISFCLLYWSSSIYNNTSRTRGVLLESVQVCSVHHVAHLCSLGSAQYA